MGIQVRHNERVCGTPPPHPTHAHLRFIPVQDIMRTHWIRPSFKTARNHTFRTRERNLQATDTRALNARVRSCRTTTENIFPDAKSISNSNYLGKKEQVPPDPTQPNAGVENVRMLRFVCRCSAAGNVESNWRTAAAHACYCRNAWTACKLFTPLNANVPQDLPFSRKSRNP